MIAKSNQITASSDLPATLPGVSDAPDNDVEYQFITFSIDKEEYGVDILAVREIIGWTDITHLPNTRDYMRGVINLRGSILPVFDLRCRFGMGLTDATASHVIIIVNVEGKQIGMLADSVSQILMVRGSEIRAIPEVGLMVDQKYLGGFASSGSRMVAILDVNLLFDPAVLEDSIEEAEFNYGGTDRNMNTDRL